MRQLVTQHPERRTLGLCSHSFFFLTQFLLPVHRLVLPTFKVGFSSPVKPLWKCSHRYSQRVIPWVPLNPAKMKTEMNLHTECPFLLFLSTMPPTLFHKHGSFCQHRGALMSLKFQPRTPDFLRQAGSEPLGGKKDRYNLVTSDTDKHQSLKTPE